MAFNRVQRPNDISFSHWNNFAHRWETMFRYDREIFKIERHQNRVIPELWLNTAIAVEDRSIKFGVWCSRSQSALWIYDGDIPNFYSDRHAACTPQAWDIIYAQVNEWIEEEEKEEEPPDEEPPPGEEEPGPIDEGDGIIDGLVADFKAWIVEAILAGLAFLDGPLNLIKDLISNLASTISKITTAISSAVETIMAKVSGVLEQIVDKIKGVIDEVWGNIEQIWETLKDMFETVKTAIVTALEVSWGWIKETFSTLWSKIRTGLEFIGNAIVSGLRYLWDKIKDALNWTWEILKSSYDSIVDGLKAVWDRFKERLTETIDSIKEALGTAIDRLVEMFEAWRESDIEQLKIDQDWPEDRFTEFILKIMGVQQRVLEKIATAKGKI